jgi:predicted pyridoxine 5'-phosphate oxidase superfamily flavin-nucleotide-binding protein
VDITHAHSSDVAFTPSVKALQARKGSRNAYGRMEERGAWQTRITPELAGFIAAQTSIFFATANADGQPYIQHRGGPPGFLIDYAHRKRIKIWGEARVVEGDAELTAKLMPEGYKARPEQVILFTVSAWDANCPQHIPQRFEAADIAAALAARDKRIEVLEAEIMRLRQFAA